MERDSKMRRSRQLADERVREALKQQDGFQRDRIKEINTEWRTRLDAAREERAKLEDLLKNLLALDPSLERFRHDVEGRDGSTVRKWNVTGVAKAVEFRETEAIANSYAPKIDAPKKSQ